MQKVSEKKQSKEKKEKKAIRLKKQEKPADMETKKKSRKKSGKPEKIEKSEKQTVGEKKEHIRFMVAAGMAVSMAFMMALCIILAVWNRSTHAVSMQPDGTAKEGKSIDTDALAKKILESVSFDVELELLEDSVAEGMIQMADGTKMQMYLGNGTNADELVIMTATNEKNAETNQSYIEEHLKEKKKQFQLYIPEQVKKIENAVKVRSGSYVIVCVTSDVETAKKTITSFLEQ